MELDGKYYSISIDTAELVKLIPENVWSKIETQLLEKAKDDYKIPFTSIDYSDQEGDKIMFGVST